MKNKLPVVIAGLTLLCAWLAVLTIKENTYGPPLAGSPFNPSVMLYLMILLGSVIALFVCAIQLKKEKSPFTVFAWIALGLSVLMLFTPQVYDHYYDQYHFDPLTCSHTSCEQSCVTVCDRYGYDPQNAVVLEKTDMACVPHDAPINASGFGCRCWCGGFK